MRTTFTYTKNHGFGDQYQISPYMYRLLYLFSYYQFDIDKVNAMNSKILPTKGLFISMTLSCQSEKTWPGAGSA